MNRRTRLLPSGSVLEIYAYKPSSMFSVNNETKFKLAVDGYTIKGLYNHEAIVKAIKLYLVMYKRNFATDDTQLVALGLGRALHGFATGRLLTGKVACVYGKIVLKYYGLNLALDNRLRLIGFNGEYYEYS